MTDTIHDNPNATAMTMKRSRQNSDAGPTEKATGMNPATVIRVPVSIGLAVARKA